MRRRRLIALGIAILAVVCASAFAIAMAGSAGALGSAEKTATAYFRAWAERDLTAMKRLVDHPPQDFTLRHLTLAESLHLEEIALDPSLPRSTGPETAEAAFSATMRLKEFGDWPYESTLRLAVRDRQWKVVWAPETLHPLLKDGGTLEVLPIEIEGVELVTVEGKSMPRKGYNDTYLDGLRSNFEGHSQGWALMANGEKIKEIPPKQPKVTTTISRQVQAAAARALDGVNDSAIVAVRSSTGAVLAVADRLEEANAFRDYFPPGSTFKVISAVALLKGGLTADTAVDCPASYQIPNHGQVRNAGDVDRGALTFGQAFAHSCNTTFVQLGTTRLHETELLTTAQEWGFTGNGLPTGNGGACGRMNEPANPDQLMLALIGQGSVEATPLCMAAVAAAVESGTWRPPRLLPVKEVERIDGRVPEPVELDPGIVAQLQEMMLTVVVGGTASEGGLPEGTAGKTGTAENYDGGDHAWFIGYRNDVAFCVFVRNGGSGAKVAVPIADRFLRGLESTIARS